MFRKNVLAITILSIMFVTVFIFGLLIGTRFNPLTGFRRDSPIPDDYLQPIERVWEIIHEQYLEQPVDDDKLIQGALRGMMESLEDPYTAYMDPEEYRMQSTPLEGEYTGIGAWVDTTGEFLVIISPMPDSPAETVGIEPGDVVVKVNGEDMTGLDPVVVLDKILGPAGTKIQLTIRRGDEMFDFIVERAVILIPSVESLLMEGNIGYIRLYSFGANSPDEVFSAIEGLRNQGAGSYIFDLRNNSGGFVDSAVEITSAFIENGTILIEEWGDGTRNEFKATGRAMDVDSPMIVLVNEGSASASEIMAGALQDYGRAKLVGTTTFGKGYIQNWIPLIDDYGAVRITIARWLTPGGRQIQGFGLAPNISVPLTEEDIQNQNDAQLAKAIMLLKDFS